MARKTEKYSDLDLVNDVGKCLARAGALADLLASYSHERDGLTRFDLTVQDAGRMLMEILTEMQDSFRKWEKQKSGEEQ
jgi:hypothetical protein